MQKMKKKNTLKHFQCKQGVGWMDIMRKHKISLAFFHNFRLLFLSNMYMKNAKNGKVTVYREPRVVIFIPVRSPSSRYNNAMC